MSLLTEVTIWTSIGVKKEAVDQFNSLLPTLGGGGGGWVLGVREIDSELIKDQAGGSKVYCGHLFAAMFNYIDIDGLIEAFYSTDWGHTDVVMIVDTEHWDDPKVFLHNVGLGAHDE